MVELDADSANAFSLKGRVAVITGAGSGIGLETARIFARAGARLVLADVDERGLNDAMATVSGAQASAYKVDISVRDEVDALARRTVTETERLDVWLNCAGIGYLHSIMETDPERVARVIAVNMMGTYWGCAAAGRAMRDLGGGTIINISSGGGSHPSPGVSIYSMTKAAVNSLTLTSAAEFGPYGIRVNAVSPGFIETPMSSAMFRNVSGEIDPATRKAVYDEMIRRSPIGLIGQPSDIAFAVLYLACDASRFVTGQILSVDGGVGM